MKSETDIAPGKLAGKFFALTVASLSWLGLCVVVGFLFRLSSECFEAGRLLAGYLFGQ